jgi:uncharacterized protein YbcI
VIEYLRVFGHVGFFLPLFSQRGKASRR